MASLLDSACIIDTETLGLDPDWHPIWEVALITDEGREWTWQLPVTGRAIDIAQAEALEINRFRDRYRGSAAATPVHAFCLELQRLTLNKALVGAVPSFDEERLRRLMWANNVTPHWHYQPVDVETLIVGYLIGKGEPAPEWPWDSKLLSKALDIEPRNFDRHTALGDCRWTKALAEQVLLQAGRLLPPVPHVLSALAVEVDQDAEDDEVADTAGEAGPEQVGG